MDRPEEVRKQHLNIPAQDIDLLCDARGKTAFNPNEDVHICRQITFRYVFNIRLLHPLY